MIYVQAVKKNLKKFKAYMLVNHQHINNSFLKFQCRGNSLAVQWLGLLASTAGGWGLIPGQGTKILQATWPGQKNNNNK